jgi:hypothetical protein
MSLLARSPGPRTVTAARAEVEVVGCGEVEGELELEPVELVLLELCPDPPHPASDKHPASASTATL